MSRPLPFRTRPILAMASRQGQGGAVAILVAFLIVGLIGFVGLVIDLANLYVRKAELQNASDAAALAGARALNGSAAGIDAAVAAAIALAGANASDLGHHAVLIGEGQVQFAAAPGGPWSSAAEARALPADKRFIRVSTDGLAEGTRPTWFMPVVNAGLDSTTTSGTAVAGSSQCENLPMFICEPRLPGKSFVPGQPAYFAGDPSVVGYYEAAPAGTHYVGTGADAMVNVVCDNRSFCIAAGSYAVLSQPAFGRMADAFDTRFGKYKGNLKPATCRPDRNVKEYLPSDTGAAQWMATPPANQLGIAWAASRPPALPGNPPVNGNYPATTSGGGTPYSQLSGADYRAPADLDYAVSGRRLITLAIADPALCNDNGTFKGTPSGSVRIAGFGRFLLTAAPSSTGNKGLYVEFIERLAMPPASLPNLKLYR